MKAVKITHHADRRVTFSYEGAPGEAYYSYACPIDALMGRIRDELRLPFNKPGIMRDLGLQGGTASRLRSGCYESVPEQWLMIMHEYSLIPIPELRAIANVEQQIFPHRNARKQT